ncbi:hypothetical protein EVAR_80567_1 [Eumeta japonica]|uniref:Uncharacterized protein n=1 Tax=Eumeta variegata TaxID=151549 RepID=A0A4C1TMP4_EUMVA|nr:hypothetical protein EVAR_80567_1 [Eumeta japonica]
MPAIVMVTRRISNPQEVLSQRGGLKLKMRAKENRLLARRDFSRAVVSFFPRYHERSRDRFLVTRRSVS